MRNLYIVLILLFILSNLSSKVAQAQTFAAAAQIIGEDATYFRANAQNSLLINAEAVTIFGPGDRIQTGDNGRVLITFSDTFQVLLLPRSWYQIDEYSQQADGSVKIDGTLHGIAIHRLDMSETSYHYTLSGDTATFTVEATSQQEQFFTVWMVDDGLQATTVASGDITLAIEDEDPVAVPENTGVVLTFNDTPETITNPLHASQVIDRLSPCHGIIETNGSEGLRLRGGAALDYRVVDVVQDGDEVTIAGTTENGLWYRIPFQTGFGWIFSSLVNADCDNLPVFPNLYREDPERIQRVTSIELPLLQPFYGTPITNYTFYR